MIRCVLFTRIVRDVLSKMVVSSCRLVETIKEIRFPYKFSSVRHYQIKPSNVCFRESKIRDLFIFCFLEIIFGKNNQLCRLILDLI